MAIKARFYIAEVAQYATGSSRPGYAEPAPMGKVVMRPVTRGEENADWASSTPAGEFQMTVRGSALEVFRENLAREVDITIDPITE